MSNFAVLRIAKITSLKSLAGIAAHNTRTATSGLDHADNHAPQMGGGIRLLAGRDNAVEAWHERAKAVGLANPRKDAVRALEAVISASPEWFSQASPKDRLAWCNQSLVWAIKTFGRDNLLSAHMHDDEACPHLHVLVIPLAEKTRKKAGRPRKGRKTAPRATVASWGLAAADLIGSPKKLTALQTSYASEVANLGIRRGRPRRVTGARHRSAAAYRAEASELFSATQDDRIEAMDELSIAKGARMFAEIDAKSITAAAKQSAAETATAFTAGLDAIDGGELVYCPANDRRAAGLERKKVEAPCLPTSRSGFKKWQLALGPLISQIVEYARRLNKVSKREQEVALLSKDLAVEAGAINRVMNRQAEAERAAGVTAGPAKHDAEILVRSKSRQVTR